MKNYFFLSIIAAALALAGCSPKTGGNQPSAITGTGTAPKIPIPGGDVRKQAPMAGEAPKIQIGKAETFTLENGLTVIVVENHKLPRVSFRLFVDYGPVLEKEAAGYIDIMGSMLEAGTKIRSKAQINQEIDFIGASLYTDAHGISGFCLKKHSDKLLNIMSDVLLYPTFPQEELDKEKVQASSALAAAKEDASDIMSNVASRLRYGKDHPYGEVMTESSLSKITIEQIKNHYKTYFKPNISYLVVTGDITKEQAEKSARQYFGKWAKGDVPKQNYGIPRPPNSTQVDFVNKTGAVQSVISVTYPIDLQPGTQDVIPCRVANTLLGGGFVKSRLNSNLREKHGWTYGAGSSLNADELVGYFSAGASVRNAVTDSSITEIIKEMRRLTTEKVGKEELQIIKNVITGEFSRNLEEPGTVANFALNTARYKLPADYYEKYLSVLQNVSPELVQSVAKKYINPDKAHVIVVGNRDDVAERLKQFSATGKINYFDAFGNPVNTSNVPLPPGMTAEKVIQDYLQAIGGSAKIAALKDLQTEATMQMRGPAIGVKIWQKGGNKIALEMSMNGQVMNKQVFDGENGEQSGMGQKAPIEGESLNDLKEQAKFVKEASYLSGGYKLTLKGIEEVEGANAYVLEVERPDGKKLTEYYDMKSSLKLREVSMGQGADGNPGIQTVDFGDYKATEGVLFPHSSTVSGVFPVPFKISISSIKVNSGVDDAAFKL